MKLLKINFINIENKINFLKVLLSLSVFSTFLISLSLWHTSRTLPTSPIISGFEISAQFNFLLLSVLIAAVFSIAFLKKPVFSISITLIIGGYLTFLDINRLQPQFYIFFLTLLLFLLYYKNSISKEELLQGIKIILCAVYFWSGIHKLNNEYERTYLWLIDSLLKNPAENIFYIVLKKIGYLTPYIEILIPVGLIFSPYKKTFIMMAVLMHVFILLCLSPLGRDYNYIVFPWNIFMAVSILTIFMDSSSQIKKKTKLKESPIVIGFCLIWILPALNFFNLFDSYLSFDLYSGKYKEGIIYMKDYVVKKLPSEIKPYVELTQENQYRIILNKWALKDIKTPLYPEIRVLKNYRKYFQQFADNPNDIGLVMFQNKKYILIN
jgi:hypothetical protein